MRTFTKQQSYPWRPKGAKRMTMIAGMVGDDGVVLCSDSLVTDGTVAEHREKIHVWIGRQVVVAFAFAGLDVPGRQNIDHCIQKLTPYLRRKPTALRVRQALESAIGDAAATRMSVDDVDMLIAVTIAGFPATLYVVRQGAMATVRSFDCCGTGRENGYYVLQCTYDQFADVETFARIGLQAFALAKANNPSVDGNPQFFTSKHGAVGSLVASPLAPLEQVVIDCHARFARLLRDVGDPGLSMKQIDTDIDRALLMVRQSRPVWLSAFRAARVDASASSIRRPTRKSPTRDR